MRARAAVLHLLVLAAYLLLALFHLHPLGGRLGDEVVFGSLDDVLLHGWIINWTARQLVRDPLALFDANSFFPYPDSLAYTEHMIPEALPAIPVRAVSGDPVLAYNVAFLATFVLGGWGTFLLVRRLTGDTAAAFVAGAFACWFPAKRWALAHVNTIAVHGLPFALLALHRLVSRPGLKRTLVAGVAAAFAALASAYYTVYVPLLLAAAGLLLLWAGGHGLERRRLAYLGCAGVLCGLVMAPVLLTYASLWEPAAAGFEYSYQPGSVFDIADLFILDSWLWGGLTVPKVPEHTTGPYAPGLIAAALIGLALLGAGPRRRDQWRPGPVALVGYAAIGVGGVALLATLLRRYHAWLAGTESAPAWGLSVALMALGILAVAALERRRFPRAGRWILARLRAAPRAAIVYAALAALAFGLAMGPRLQLFGYLGPRLPAWWAMQTWPFLGALRAPYRAAYLAEALLAVLVGLGAAVLLERQRQRRRSRAPLLATLLCLGMTIEFAGPRLHMSAPPAPRPVDHWLAAQPGDFGILELPQPPRLHRTARGQWRSVYHWKRRVTGHNTRQPATVARAHRITRGTVDDVALDWVIEHFPVRYVVWETTHLSDADRQALVDLSAPAFDTRADVEAVLEGAVVLRLRNGGELGRLRRRFPRRMVQGRLRIEFAEELPAAVDGVRLHASVDGQRLGARTLRAGQRRASLAVPELVAGAPLVWLTLRTSAPDVSLRVRSIEFVSDVR